MIFGAPEEIHVQNTIPQTIPQVSARLRACSESFASQSQTGASSKSFASQSQAGASAESFASRSQGAFQLTTLQSGSTGQEAAYEDEQLRNCLRRREDTTIIPEMSRSGAHCTGSDALPQGNVGKERQI